MIDNENHIVDELETPAQATTESAEPAEVQDLYADQILLQFGSFRVVRPGLRKKRYRQGV